MALQIDPSGKDDKNEIKTHFVTREGVYRILNSNSEDFVNRPRPGVGYQSNQSSPQVRVSFVSLPAAASGVGGASQTSAGASGNLSAASNGNQTSDCQSVTTSGNSGGQDRICFNIGKELYVYSFKGIRKPADLSKPVDKKLYKGTNPSCHDFNGSTATSEGAPLLVGFTTGQIQLVHPGKREQGKLYNEERLIDKTKVTCLKWVPGSANLFLAAHASGNMYLYNDEFPSTPVAPSYQPFKSGDGFAVMMCKSKAARNPLYKWTFGNESYSINELSFSPCGANLAIVTQDGFLRIFQYSNMELIGVARSYFGGFLCVCWSPDGKYIVVGGEDDLVTVYSLTEKRVVARGQGHRSWVSVVAFDPFTTSYTNWDGPDFSDDENPINESYHRYVNHQHEGHGKEERVKKTNSASTRDSLAPDKLGTSYRLGSVGQDTQLCLWDITDDVLRQIGHRPRLNSHEPLVNGDGSVVPLIKPTAVLVGAAKDQVDASAPSRTAPGKLLNCTNVESSDSKEVISSDNSSKFLTNSGSGSSSTSNKTSNSLVGNCVGSSVSTSKDSLNDKSASSTLSSRHSTSCGGGGGGGDAMSTATLTPTTGSNNLSLNHANHSSSAFNTLTAKLSNFSFGSDKANGGKNNKKRPFTLSKSSEKQILNHINGSSSSAENTSVQPATNSLTKSSKSLSNSTTSGAMSASTISTVDNPMKLIGTPACPRFDDTPVLEPLVCKKIAHERLTALIFREDCFITACQDGLIYTWARPGFGYQQNVQHNLPAIHNSTMPGGTVV